MSEDRLRFVDRDNGRLMVRSRFGPAKVVFIDKTRSPIVKKGVESRQHVLYGLSSGTLTGESNGSSIRII
jgi:hypothetical protein